MKKPWQAFITFILVTCLIVLTNPLAHSQPSPTPENKLDSTAVIFNNQTLS